MVYLWLSKYYKKHKHFEQTNNGRWDVVLTKNIGRTDKNMYNKFGRTDVFRLKNAWRKKL